MICVTGHQPLRDARPCNDLSVVLRRVRNCLRIIIISLPIPDKMQFNSVAFMIQFTNFADNLKWYIHVNKCVSRSTHLGLLMPLAPPLPSLSPL